MKYLSSWWTTAGIALSCAAAYIVFLSGSSPYADWTNFLFHRPAGMLLYCALLVNILLASVRIVIAKLSLPEPTPAAIQEMDACAVVQANASDRIITLAAFAKEKGFTVSGSSSRFCAKMNRYSFLPGTLLRGGIIILLAAMLLSVHTRRSTETILHAGGVVGSAGDQLIVESVSSDLPDRFLQVGEENSFRLSKVRALLKSSGGTDTITTGFPAYIKGKYYRITHFGFTLPVKITGRSGDMSQSLDLDILPPGAGQSVPLTTPDIFMSFSLQPERTITKGLLKGKEYNLSIPTYHVVIQQGTEKEKIGEFDVTEGGTAGIPSLSLSIGSHSYYCRVQVVSDPALPFVYAGVLMTLLGAAFMFSRFFWYEKEVAAVLEGNALHIGYREEFFRKWGIQKFHGWMEELGGGEEAS